MKDWRKILEPVIKEPVLTAIVEAIESDIKTAIFNGKLEGIAIAKKVFNEVVEEEKQK